MRQPTLCRVLLALSTHAMLALGADYYVSTTGSDSNAGTAAAPFLTLSKAQIAVRSQLASQTSDIYVYVADGTYELSAPLNLTAADSGQNGYKVIWEAQGTGVNLSGGTQITGWTAYSAMSGVYKASVPANSKSRHLYANNVHAQRARSALTRSWLKAASNGYTIADNSANYLLTLSGIEHGEIRGINSWTDRYLPISSVSGGTIIMQEPSYQNNQVGFDTITHPNADKGFYIENVLALLNSPNEFYLNSTTSTVYYMPPTGTNVADMTIVLPRLEQLVVFSGTLDNVVHDITFSGFNFMHTTWNYPSSSVGYCDQQTGGYWGQNKAWTNFEASRDYWWQVPGSVQISAASDIVIQNGSMTALMGGFGVGNDPNAHTSGVGLGTKKITISGIYFTQTGHNCITVGGIQPNAHHPTDSRMINSDILISENVFTDTQITYTSGVPILVTYVTNAKILHNDLSHVPYSGICYGYGWGVNDAGGVPEYVARGTYNYQTKYTTPTTLMNGLISNNLIHNYGEQHTDLGGIYTLSKSPNTLITENYAYSPNGYGLYNDEGSRDYVHTYSVFNTSREWLNRNENKQATTGNLTYANCNTNKASITSQKNSYGDTITDVTNSNAVNLPLSQKRVVYTAGISPFRRSNLKVSINPPAVFLALSQSGSGITVDVQNLGPDPLTNVAFVYTMSNGGALTPSGSPPKSIAGNGESSFSLTASKTGTVSISVTYTSVTGHESISKTIQTS